ncbi:hypothetical protein FRB99_005417, partial [Tulasnella sp. 403]
MDKGDTQCRWEQLASSGRNGPHPSQGRFDDAMIRKNYNPHPGDIRMVLLIYYHKRSSQEGLQREAGRDGPKSASSEGDVSMITAEARLETPF